MPSQRSPEVLLWVMPLLQALENPGQHHTFHDQRTRKHASASSSGIRKPKTGARDDGMSTPAPAPFSLLPQDLADPATYRGDDGSHAEGLLEDKSPPFFCRGGDDVSVNTAGFLWKPLQEVGRIENFSLCLLQWLSLNSIRRGHTHYLLITRARFCVSQFFKAASRIQESPITNPLGGGEISSLSVSLWKRNHKRWWKEAGQVILSHSHHLPP